MAAESDKESETASSANAGACSAPDTPRASSSFFAEWERRAGFMAVTIRAGCDGLIMLGVRRAIHADAGQPL
nr:hypothetical protein [Burkholderia multivorans]